MHLCARTSGQSLATEAGVAANDDVYRWPLRAQAVVVIDVFLTTAQAAEPLGYRVTQGMRDPRRRAAIKQHVGYRQTQTDPAIDLTQ